MAALTWFVALWMATCSAWGQTVHAADGARQGRHLAIMLCQECHVVAPDQDYAPSRVPPAPSFDSVAQRKDIDAESLQTFLVTTHDGLENPKGMRNPSLADFQVKAIVAYILSLRK